MALKPTAVKIGQLNGIPTLWFIVWVSTDIGFLKFN